MRVNRGSSRKRSHDSIVTGKSAGINIVRLISFDGSDRIPRPERGSGTFDFPLFDRSIFKIPIELESVFNMSTVKLRLSRIRLCGGFLRDDFGSFGSFGEDAVEKVKILGKFCIQIIAFTIGELSDFIPSSVGIAAIASFDLKPRGVRLGIEPREADRFFIERGCTQGEWT